MLLYESVFFGVKSLFYGLPVSFGIIHLLYLSFDGMYSYGKMLIPYSSIFIAISAVFVIIFLSTAYATGKIRKENIL